MRGVNKKKENGSALVFGLMVVMGMVVLVTALGSVMNTGRNIDNFNEQRISADYKAEAAIEKALNMIIKRHKGFVEGEITVEEIAVFESDLEAIKGSLIEQDDYKVKKAVIEIDADLVKYHITGWGRTGKVEKTIETILAPKPVNMINMFPVVAGGEIIGGEDEDENYGGEYEDGGKSPIEFRKAGKEQTGITPLDGTTFSDFKEKEGTYIYENSLNIDLKKGNGQGSDEADEFKEQITLGKVILVEGDLTISAGGNQDLKSGTGIPAVVLVEGDLTLTRIRDIEDVVFIAKGEITYNGQGAHGNLTDCFLYSEGSITFGRDHGNEILNPFFEITGQVLARGDISFYNHHSSFAAFAEISMPERLQYLKRVDVEMVSLTTWNERN